MLVMLSPAAHLTCAKLGHGLASRLFLGKQLGVSYLAVLVAVSRPLTLDPGDTASSSIYPRGTLDNATSVL